MISNYEDLVPDMADDLPRCPAPAMVDALRRAFREFCRKTRIWREWLAINQVDGETTYTIIVPYDADLLTANELRLRTAAQVTAGEQGGLVLGHLWKVTQDPGQLPKLWLDWEPREDITGGLYLEIVMAPNPDVRLCENTDVLMTYADGIRARAVAILASRPNRPWSSDTVMADRQAEYWSDVNRAMADVRLKRRNQSQRGMLRG